LRTSAPTYGYSRTFRGIHANKEQAVRNQIAEAQKIANGSGSEQDIAEAKIELEVLESLQAALK
jgi:hypothetical protein